ncbi:hypothetical protein JG687_00015936 [Phytophthora cactorum]|uniref:Uncharacterized protein n=1 Tax=Phytophthora cactorum TaxID=29920 RepID=A0A8T1TSE0_9STRA|nr:hypothetical protein PC120_g23191 [Phytophthora cactorum]KAG3050147.1 hypothetical protein PC121_g18555 [Phytophthora cactorum]KAG4040801.1 hypothetical protein PC123_g23666 [Phytophthora cactorum]KAG6947707.1 hypothetical protein JG687_00015936 [Phytophthora cactorum]
MSHLGSVHPTHDEEYEQFQRRNLTSLEVFGFANETTTNMYDWLRWIVERNLPLSEVENSLTRQLVRMRPTSAITLKTYMERVAGRVGNTIAKEMGALFGIMWDSWSSGTYHYVAVVTVYAGSNGRVERVIALSPTVDGQTAGVKLSLLKPFLPSTTRLWRW